MIPREMIYDVEFAQESFELAGLPRLHLNSTFHLILRLGQPPELMLLDDLPNKLCR
jgi:hypothetical protein